MDSHYNKKIILLFVFLGSLILMGGCKSEQIAQFTGFPENVTSEERIKIDPKVMEVLVKTNEVRIIIHLKEGEAYKVTTDRILSTLNQVHYKLIREIPERNKFVVIVDKENFERLKNNSMISVIYYDSSVSAGEDE